MFRNFFGSSIGKASSFFRRLRAWLLQLSRPVRRAIVMASDLLVLSGTMAILVWARMVGAPAFESPSTLSLLALAALPVISVIVLYVTGFYAFVTRHIGRKGAWHIGGGLLVAIMTWALLIFLAEWRTGVIDLPRTVVVAYFFAGWLGILMVRELARLWLDDQPLAAIPETGNCRKRVFIYGAGKPGATLLKLLRQSGKYDVRGFLERDPSLHGMKMLGRYPVHDLRDLGVLLKREGVEEIIVSTPRLSRAARRRIVNELAHYPVRLRVVSEPDDILSGNATSVDLKEVDIKDLLGREPVRPIRELLEANVTGKSVMVTGAGGSIGSQIVRQTFALKPRKLVLFELSEYALYKIEQELRDSLDEQGEENAPEIVPVLGSVGDEVLVRRVIREQGVQTIYHAAAYKHIPLLEENVRAAVENNVLATATLARVAGECGVERMVHISSDKAVRPANVKGATNRLQEHILQACARKWPHGTVFTAVRFGNVLGSSGSVVPRFREQIARGGPVTVTHPEITRYFMSIEEAAELVIQAGAMANSGDIFALDMGKPIKIIDLARLMIHLAGLTVADENNPEGDIELKITGPRPGDKLYEELLISGNAVGTKHPFIMRLDEPDALSPEQVKDMLEQLQAAFEKDDTAAMLATLEAFVEDYTPATRCITRAAQGGHAGEKVISDKVISLVDYTK